MVETTTEREITMSEKEKFFDWYKDQVDNHGLKGMHITGAHVLEDFGRWILGEPIPKGDVSEEEIYGELNRMISAPRIPWREDELI